MLKKLAIQDVDNDAARILSALEPFSCEHPLCLSSAGARAQPQERQILTCQWTCNNATQALQPRLSQASKDMQRWSGWMALSLA